MCVCERETERESVCVRERESLCVLEREREHITYLYLRPNEFIEYHNSIMEKQPGVRPSFPFNNASLTQRLCGCLTTVLF